jgi:adenylate cyclase
MKPAPETRLQTPAGTGGGAFESRLRDLADWLTMMIPAALGIAIVILLSNAPFVDRLRNVAFDQYQRWEPRWWSYGTPLRVIDIDDESLARLGPWPWPRRQMAELVESLKGNGAGVIAFDILLSEPDRYSPEAILSELPELPEREILAAALSARRELSVDPLQKAFEDAPVVAGFALTASPTDSVPLKSSFATQGADPVPALRRFVGMIPPVLALRTAAKGLGAINDTPDADQVTRKAPLLLAVGPAGGNVVLAPSLAAEALRVAFGAEAPVATAIAPLEGGWGARTRVTSVKIGDSEIPTESDGSIRIRFSGQQKDRRIPAWQILNGDVHRDEILGRIMLIGASARELVDLRATPLNSATPSIDIHAELIEQVLTGARLIRPHWAPMAEGALILLGALIIGLAVRRLRPLAAFLTAALIVGTQAEASWLAFLRTETLIDPMAPGLSLAATWICAALVVRRRVAKDQRFVRSAFERHLAPAAVDALASNAAKLRLGGEIRETSVLACGLPDFPARAQQLEPRGAVALLNWLHTTLTAAALAKGGTIDRYHGAGLNAFWNAPVESPDHPDQACAAALGMVEAMARLNGAMAEAAVREGKNHLPLRLGIGIGCGPSLVGDMGSMQRFDYSVMGESVTQAVQLQALTNACGLPILVSSQIASGAQDHLFAPLGNLAGAASGPIFALHAKTSSQNIDFVNFLEAHQRVLNAIDAGEADADCAIAAALTHPAGARYASFYSWKQTSAANL